MRANLPGEAYATAAAHPLAYPKRNAFQPFKTSMEQSEQHRVQQGGYYPSDVERPHDPRDRWYVAQVVGGREESTLEQCRKLVDSDVLKECFAPEAEYPWKTKDGWQVRKKLLFPGYLFYVTADVDELYDQLARVPAVTKLLGNGAKGVKRVFFPLTDDERDWFLAFTDRKRVVRMSEGYIEGDTVKVTSGPLCGREASIRKIDRHKRRAYIDVSLFGRTVPASVGLEILWKSQVA